MTAPQRSPEWFAARKGRVTGSIAGAILGLSPFMSREDALRSMVRATLGAPSEFTGNAATEWGNANEDGACFEYEMETTHQTQETGFHTVENWLGCSPDRLVGDNGGLEVKCPYGLRNDPEPAFKSIYSKDLAHYMAQVQLCLFVLKRSWWHFFQWTPYGTKLETVKPDQDWLSDNLPRLRQFHAEYLDALSNPEPYLEEKRILVDTPEAHKLLAEYDDLSEAISRADERKKEVLASLVALAKERNAEVAGRKLTKVEKEGAISYAKAIKELLPKADLSKWKGKPSSFWKLS